MGESKGPYESDDKANSHPPNHTVCQPEHHFLTSRSSFSGSLTFLFFLGAVPSSWLKPRSRQLSWKNHQTQGSFSGYRLLLDESRNPAS